MKINEVKKGIIYHFKRINEPVEFIAIVTSTDTNSFHTKDIQVIKGKCGNKAGIRGFNNKSIKFHCITKLLKTEYPEYYI